MHRSYNTRLRAHDDEADSTGALTDLVAFLNTPIGLQVFKHAYRANMEYKVQKYEALRDDAERSVTHALAVVRLQVDELKRDASVSDEHDNWSIFESVNGRYKDAKAESATFAAILARARSKLEGSMSTNEVRPGDVAIARRDELVRALRRLTIHATSQPHIVTRVVALIASFIKSPTLFRTKLMNIMLLGGAGTGKTTLAGDVARAFANAGMFVSGEVVEAGRAELVAQYEGQTVSRTKQFLTSNLDNGVIFIDEAYGITPWLNGKPEGYGSEAATAMVEFMTKYPGLYCIIVAGYETQMLRYFLGTNEGLSRRFPHKFVLRRMSTADLLLVFRRKLLSIQGIELEDDALEGHGLAYFSKVAWDYLAALVTECARGDNLLVDEEDESTRRRYKNVSHFRPRHDLMHALVEHQAGSMANLADEAMTMLVATVPFERVYQLQRRGLRAPLPIAEQPLDVMRAIVRNRVRSMALTMTDACLDELAMIERMIGY